MNDKEHGVPKRRQHLFEQIHDIFWDKIIAGEIVPSERLKDTEWAAKLAVSRTPVREAMRKMQQEGVLLPMRQGGYQVRPVADSDLRGLYRCRAALESLAAKEVASKGRTEVTETLEGIIDQADQAIQRNDLDTAFHLNTDFHRLLVEFSDNSHLIGLWDGLQRLIVFYRSALLNRVKAGAKDRRRYVDRLCHKQDEHRDIVNAIAHADEAQAASLMSDHLLETAKDMDIDT